MADEALPQIRPIVTCSQAKALGLTRYFITKSCPQGHVAERLTRSSQCLDCLRERTRRWQKKNPKKHSEHVCRWAKKNPEKKRDNNRRWSERNPEKESERRRRWRKQNPEKKRSYKHRSRARKRNSGGTYTAGDIKDIRKLQRNRCARCGESLKSKSKTIHIDHITPLALGGANDRRNIQLLCEPCNRSKGARDPIDDMRLLGRLL